TATIAGTAPRTAAVDRPRRRDGPDDADNEPDHQERTQGNADPAHDAHLGIILFVIPGANAFPRASGFLAWTGVTLLGRVGLQLVLHVLQAAHQTLVEVSFLKVGNEDIPHLLGIGVAKRAPQAVAHDNFELLRPLEDGDEDVHLLILAPALY